MPTSATHSPNGAFERRFAAWESNHIRHGPARSYPHAWRLPELARPLGGPAVARADFALGLTLHTMGRFGEALACLPDPYALPAGARAQAIGLHLRCLYLLGMDAAAADLLDRWRADASCAAQRERAYLAFLRDDPQTALPLCLHCLEVANDVANDARQAAWLAVLRHWAEARLRLAGDVAGVHAALRGLRTSAPVCAAHAEAIYAEAAYRQGPAWAVTWLDAALDRCESHGQHHIKARLLLLKAKALAAAGQLGESGRFLKLARELARRQGAGLYQREMAR